MLVLFPERHGVVLTWDNLWPLIKRTYGSEVDAALRPFRQGIEELQQRMVATPNPEDYYHEIDSEVRVIHGISELPVPEKHDHLDFMSKERLLETVKPRRPSATCCPGSNQIRALTLLQARAFLDHSASCSGTSTGTGLSPDGAIEVLVPNVPLEEIDGVVKVELDVREEDF